MNLKPVAITVIIVIYFAKGLKIENDDVATITNIGEWGVCQKFSGDNQNVSERAKSVGNRQILRFGTPRIGRKGDL